MTKDRPNGEQDRRPIIVSDALAARQWEAHLAADHLAANDTVWVSAPVIAYPAWLEQLFAATEGTGASVLSRLQAEALWRQIIADSPEGATLVSDRGAAQWAAEAWSLIQGWGADMAGLREGATGPDTRAFVEWCDAYRSVLTDRRWTDRAQLEQRLANAAPTAPMDIVVADLGEPVPARKSLFARLEAQGWHMEAQRLPATGRATHQCVLPDEAGELFAAAAWALQRLDRGEARCVALVVPGLARRSDEVARVLDGLGAAETWPVWQSVTPHGADALVGAALTGIELVSPRATFTTLSRWLRSPLFGPADPAARSARAMLELELRIQARSQLPLQAAYRDAGLATWLRDAAPDVEAALTAAVSELGEHPTATPGQWAHRWQRALMRLGWPPTALPQDHPSVQSWQQAIDDFVTLTPIVGPIGSERALEELERVVRRRPAAVPLPTSGVHVFGHPDSVGPGYDAAWMTGMTDVQWPEPMRPNPLLPRALQRQLGMPWSSPEDARGRSARSLARLRASVPDVVLSRPGRLYDYETESSPALGGLPELPRSETDALLAGKSTRRRTSARARETLPDTAPALRTRTLRGGTAVLRMQARCPLRAFCEYRLAARPLPPRVHGLSARARGIAAHRALELLLRSLPAQAELEERRGAIRPAVDRALREAFGGAHAAFRVLFELESTKLSEILAKLLDQDERRSPFTVAAVEASRDVRLGEWTIRTRVDRLDALAAGGVAVIDYKTGARASPADWLTERLHDAQVPLYAVTAEAPVRSAAIARLYGRDASYAGFWEDGTFPSRARRLPDGRTWDQQLAVWRAQIVQLIEEFAAGDTRLFPDELDEARAAYAPLTRVVEQLALSHGGPVRW